MPIAHYTARLIEQLVNDGECQHFVAGRVTVGVARSRIQNAASRIKMSVSTEWDPITHKVWGYETKG